MIRRFEEAEDQEGRGDVNDTLLQGSGTGCHVHPHIVGPVDDEGWRHIAWAEDALDRRHLYKNEVFLK